MADTHVQSGVDFGTAGPGLLRSLANNWWLLLLRGMAAIAFGVLAFFWPGLTLITLTLLWGAYALVRPLGMSALALIATELAHRHLSYGGRYDP